MRFLGLRGCRFCFAVLHSSRSIFAVVGNRGVGGFALQCRVWLVRVAVRHGNFRQVCAICGGFANAVSVGLSVLGDPSLGCIRIGACGSVLSLPEPIGYS